MVLLVLIALSGYIFMALKQDLPAGTVQLDERIFAHSYNPEISWPTRGRAALGTLDDGALVRSHQEEEPQPIASLAKVITALAVLEKAPLRPGENGITFVLDAADEALYHEYLAKQGAVTAVSAGERMNQYHALQAMLLPSSNNMSDSLVRRVFGSVEQYTEYANDMVKRYGLTHTHIDDASGFSPRSVSTTSEMIKIGQKALAHPVIAEIVAQENADIPLSGVVPNYSLILEDKSVSGIKIGNTDEAGWCLLFSARHTNDAGQQVTLIGVVLGEENPERLRDSSEELLASAKTSLRQVEVIRGGDTIGTYTVPWGAKTDLVAQESLWSYGWQDDSTQTGFQPHDLNGQPVKEKQAVGELRVGDDSENSVQVVSSAAIPQPSLLWRLRSSLPFVGDR